ncbi:MAG: hypothetical protein LBU85_05215, partial [Treponema sp.]|nr:hypothetical protein [Treponema sp.]
MKKVFFGAALIACIMLVSACRTVSNENQSGNEGQSGDAVYKSIYDKYRSGLILTGASTYTVKSG